MLNGKRVLVTGSTSGIGWGVAEAFAKEGCHVMLHGLECDMEKIHTMQQKISSLSQQRCEYTSADISKKEECFSLIEKTVKAFGGLDILVNNAGIQHTDPVESFPDDKWQAILSINLSAAFYTTKAVIPSMYQQKWGRLIHIASTHGHVASTHKAAYVSAKHGLVGFSKVVALEASGTGVTSNTICPGWVLTPLVQKQIEANAKEQNISIAEAKKNLLFEKQPSGEFVTPEELGGLAVFLSSQHADQITGSSLIMDGGWTAR